MYANILRTLKAKTMLKKNKAGIVALSNYKTFSKAIVFKTHETGVKI
jgi:hypothetical protein